MIVEFGCIREPLPFSNVESKQGFVAMTTGALCYSLEMLREIFAKKKVKLFAQKVC